jgi:hypothetical protein
MIYLMISGLINLAADHDDKKRFGEAVILCFIHAVVGIDKVAGNDKQHEMDRFDCCGTPAFQQEVCLSCCYVDISALIGVQLANYQYICMSGRRDGRTF